MASLATCIPAQLALARYLERGHYDRHLRGLRLTLRKQRDDYIDAIGRSFPPDTRISRPSGGYFLWLELPPGSDALALQRRAMRAGVSIAPGPMFSAAHGFHHCLRINYGHPLTTRAEAALQRVGRLAMRQHGGA